MIGVIAENADHVVVREFFELFKTPWEFYSSEQKYDVVLCTVDARFAGTAKVILYYSGKEIQLDARGNDSIRCQERKSTVLQYGDHRIPLYGDTLTFAGAINSFLLVDGSEEYAAYRTDSSEGIEIRIGYDLFDEIHTLLTTGQPAANAGTPTLDLHIAILRNIITGCGLPVVEIPPIPAGFGCTVCLTHDVDHPSIRRHRWDHTTFGFIYRGVIGSFRNFVRGRISARSVLANWVAVAKLPFVHAGLAKDFWGDFDDSYLKLEDGLRSTFFVIPFKGRPGRKAHGPAPAIRAANYGAHDIADSIQKLKSAGCEIGLHGIDAWIDSARGREELEEIKRITGNSDVGVRTHWLYNEPQSPAKFEAAGAAYDSTNGYNETVGYRAGTTQVFKPLNANHMLELPLHAMDTALFYPSYLALSENEAIKLLRGLIDNAFDFGGVLTINWHDRSLAPERLWGECYREVIDELRKRGVWFATAGEVASWFQKRRSSSFGENSTDPENLRVKQMPGQRDDLPGLRLRIYQGQEGIVPAARHSNDYRDMPLNDHKSVASTSVSVR